MWPYGYTMTNVPSDMTAQDHAALATIGRKMASTNGYTPKQASDLYVSSGTSRDYQYGVYRIFAYTFEMSVKDYPDDSLIASETGRNKEAVLYLMERAWCPLGVLGATVRTARCGAFDDDLEVFRGWTPTPMAPTRRRQTPGSPAGTRPRRPAADPSSSGPCRRARGRTSRAPRPASSAGANDLDGRTTIRSPRDRPAGGRRPAADVPLRLRPQQALDRGRQPARDRRARRRQPGRGLLGRRSLGRRRRRLADRFGLARCLRRPDDPAPLRRRRRRPGQPPRGRARRHPGHPAELTSPSRHRRGPRVRACGSSLPSPTPSPPPLKPSPAAPSRS